MTAKRVTRARVLAYRTAAQGLHREDRSAGQLAVLDLGVQEAMGHPAALAFANRLGTDIGPDTVAVGPGHRLALTWTLRGAPHVHRRKDLDALTGALWPLSERDAAMRLNETGPSVQRAGIAAHEQFALAVRALRDAVPRPTAKGAASTAASAALPEPMLRDCRACGTAHLSDPAMRAAALAAGIEFEPGTSPPVLLRRVGAHLPDRPDPAALSELAHAYLTLLGPATAKDVAGYLGARCADVVPHLPDDLVEVDVDGHTTLLPQQRLDELTNADTVPVVALLGPFDPYLQARDRDLLVPDPTARNALWPVLGRPGAVLVDGEIAGTWRTTSAASGVTLTVTPFATLRASVWRRIETEAEVVARARGAARTRVARAR